MDNLPANPELNLLHIWNPQAQAYDALDLNTGKMHVVAKLESDNKQFNLQIADTICDLIREGKTLASVSRLPNMPSASRMYAWISIYPEFKLRVSEARKQRGDAHFDRVIELADAALGAIKDDIPGIKLAADIHKWAAEKSNPDLYGKKEEITNKGGSAISITLHTGVLDSQKPSDIIVDEFGNFKGFDDGTKMGLETDERELDADDRGTIELSRDRFAVRDTSDREHTTEEETEEGFE